MPAPPPTSAHAVRLQETQIPYAVRVSTRATRMRLIVKPNAQGDAVVVELVAPKGTPDDRVAAFAEQKRQWIVHAVREVEARQSRQLTQRYAHGSTLQYRGRWLTLNITASQTASTRIRLGDQFDVQVPETLDENVRSFAVERAFELWLKGRALNDIERLGAQYAAALGVSPTGYRLTNAKRRWGSCAANGIIRVHWRLVQAPVAALEYVVAHEITHLIHRHHQPPFWRALGGIMPDWQARRASLKAWETGPRVV